MEQAVDDNADVIAMSRHGDGGRRTLLLGSTAQLVLERSRLPVLLARSDV
jgi:nucleotide-binding universal stress UspA family protein